MEATARASSPFQVSVFDVQTSPVVGNARKYEEERSPRCDQRHASSDQPAPRADR